MVDTAAENGIPWTDCRAWIVAQKGPWQNDATKQLSAVTVPDYYRAPFHAYEDGNLCWEAAFEAEIASAAVGARNFPTFGSRGEHAFREAFDAALVEGGATCPASGAFVVDLGCGTGISTRRLARNYPHAERIIGVDLSPYYTAIGTFLLENAPIKEHSDGGQWINSIEKEERIIYQEGDAENTGFAGSSVDIVNLQFVAHEMPASVTMSILREAHRILKDGGQLWFSEMDFETPGYVAQRGNPLLFALIRSTEPYLDDYADNAHMIRETLLELFSSTVIIPATGRHFAIVATKRDNSDKDNFLDDRRFDANGEYKVEDTHLKAFEDKI